MHVEIGESERLWQSLVANGSLTRDLLRRIIKKGHKSLRRRASTMLLNREDMKCEDLLHVIAWDPGLRNEAAELLVGHEDCTPDDLVNIWLRGGITPTDAFVHALVRRLVDHPDARSGHIEEVLKVFPELQAGLETRLKALRHTEALVDRMIAAAPKA